MTTPAPSDIATAADTLRAQGVVCIPTETTYGLAVDARDPAALAALVRLKGRQPDAPFALIAGDRDQARTLCATWPTLAEILAQRHWPGPLTLVLPAVADLPDEITGAPALDRFGAPRGVGVRVTSHPQALALALRFGGPITATSANPTGQPAARDIATARAYFGDAITYLDSGPCPGERASTIVAIASDGRARLLRPGPIDLTQDPSIPLI